MAPSLIAGMDLVGGGSRIPWVSGLLGDSLDLSSSSLTSSDGMMNGESGNHQGSPSNDSSLGGAPGASRLRRTLDGSSSVAVGAAFAASGLSYVQGDNGGAGRLEKDTETKIHIDVRKERKD